MHIDLYRIAKSEELWELGWQDLGTSNEIIIVEWPEHAEEMLPTDRWEITLHYVDGDPNLRSIEVVRVGSPLNLPGFPVSLNK